MLYQCVLPCSSKVTPKGQSVSATGNKEKIINRIIDWDSNEIRQMFCSLLPGDEIVVDQLSTPGNVLHVALTPGLK